MSDVIKVEFGKEDREHARRFARLMGLVEAHEADVLADPIKHMQMAAEKIAKLNMKLTDAREAWDHRSGPARHYSEEIEPPGISDTIVVTRRDWDALCRMRDIIKDG